MRECQKVICCFFFLQEIIQSVIRTEQSFIAQVQNPEDNDFCLIQKGFHFLLKNKVFFCKAKIPKQKNIRCSGTSYILKIRRLIMFVLAEKHNVKTKFAFFDILSAKNQKQKRKTLSVCSYLTFGLNAVPQTKIKR